MKKKGKREREEKRKKKVYSEVFDFSNTNFADLTFLCFLPFLYSLKNVIPFKYVCFFLLLLLQGLCVVFIPNTTGYDIW